MELTAELATELAAELAADLAKLAGHDGLGGEAEKGLDGLLGEDWCEQGGTDELGAFDAEDLLGGQ